MNRNYATIIIYVLVFWFLVLTLIMGISFFMTKCNTTTKLKYPEEVVISPTPTPNYRLEKIAHNIILGDIYVLYDYEYNRICYIVYGSAIYCDPIDSGIR